MVSVTASSERKIGILASHLVSQVGSYLLLREGSGTRPTLWWSSAIHRRSQVAGGGCHQCLGQDLAAGRSVGIFFLGDRPDLLYPVE